MYSSLERKEENVQEYAVAAFRAISATYGISEQEKTICLDKIATAGQMYGRRGYALALGTVSYRSEKKVWLPEIIDKMCAATRVQARLVLLNYKMYITTDPQFYFSFFSKSNKRTTRKQRETLLLVSGRLLSDWIKSSKHVCRSSKFWI